MLHLRNFKLSCIPIVQIYRFFKISTLLVRFSLLLRLITVFDFFISFWNYIFMYSFFFFTFLLSAFSLEQTQDRIYVVPGKYTTLAKLCSTGNPHKNLYRMYRMRDNSTSQYGSHLARPSYLVAPTSQDVIPIPRAVLYITCLQRLDARIFKLLEKLYFVISLEANCQK